MKKQLILILFAFWVTSSIYSQSLEYFYFGSEDFIGEGLVSENGKEGVWKVYQRKILSENPSESMLQVDKSLFEQKFNWEKPVYSINFKENQLDGLFEEFFSSGAIKKLANYSKGILEGGYFEFFESGAKRVTGSFSDDKLDQEWIVYYPSGIKESERTFDKNELNGDLITYYPSGQISLKSSFLEGEIDGESVRFYENGNPASRATISKGDKSTTIENYDEKGVLTSRGKIVAEMKEGEWEEKLDLIEGFYRKGNYSKNQKDGVWEVIGTDDFIYQTENYSENKLILISEFKTKAGEFLTPGSFRNGKGTRLVYSPEGNLHAKGPYRKGIKSGTWYFYFPQSNNVLAKGKYKLDYKSGTWDYYSFEGQLVSRETFQQNWESDLNDFDRKLNSFKGNSPSQDKSEFNLLRFTAESFDNVFRYY